MLEIFIIFYCIKSFLEIYTLFMQIKYVKKAKNLEPIILLDSSKYKEAANCSIGKDKLEMYLSGYNFILFILWILFGLSYLDSVIQIDSYYLKAIIFVNTFIFINLILTLPFKLFITLNLDKKYSFLHITPTAFIKDTMDSLLLFLVLGSIIIGLFSFIINSFSNWWILIFAFIFIFIIFIKILVPMIKKGKKLKDKELKNKIRNLLDKVDFKCSGIFSVKASKDDDQLNAYFEGLGVTKRIVLTDILIEKLTHNEILAVLGHELGHFKNNDMFKNIAIIGIVIFLVSAIFGNLPPELFLELKLNNEPYAIITVAIIFSPIFLFLTRPIIYAISRHIEYVADEFGSNLSTKEDLVNVLLKLANENKSFPLSNPMYILFYHTHPPLVKRFKKLGFDVYTMKFIDKNK